MEGELLHKELSYIIRGLLYAVHNELGHYCTEKQYGDCFERLLKEGNIEYKREFALPPAFSGEHLGRNKVDFLIDGKIIVEFKCVRLLSPDHFYQCQRYLKAAKLELALLVNFRSRLLTIRRILNTSDFKRVSK